MTTYQGEILARKSLIDVLKDMGPMPQEALFLGVCQSDGLPVLHDLANNDGKPFLVMAPEGWGKTSLLKMWSISAQSVMGRNVATLVLADRPDEWTGMAKFAHVVQINDEVVTRGISAAVRLARSVRGHQYGMVLVDGWQALSDHQRAEVAQLQESKIFTVIVSSEPMLGVGFHKLCHGERPGCFIAPEGDQWVEFYVPALGSGS